MDRCCIVPTLKTMRYCARFYAVFCPACRRIHPRVRDRDAQATPPRRDGPNHRRRAGVEVHGSKESRSRRRSRPFGPFSERAVSRRRSVVSAMSDATKQKEKYVTVPMGRSMSSAGGRAQRQWLASMSEKHRLSNPSKALRCCVNCVASDYSRHEPWIASFEREHSGTHTLSDEEREEGPAFELARQQMEWIDGMRCEDGHPDIVLHRALLLRRIVDHCQNQLDEDAVFGVMRCKSSLSRCEGARRAVKDIAELSANEEGDVEVRENLDLVKGKTRP